MTRDHSVGLETFHHLDDHSDPLHSCWAAKSAPTIRSAVAKPPAVLERQEGGMMEGQGKAESEAAGLGT